MNLEKWSQIATIAALLVATGAWWVFGSLGHWVSPRIMTERLCATTGMWEGRAFGGIA
jgi:hypothetical protein